MQLYYRRRFGYAIKLQVNDKERNKIVRYFVVSADSRINIRTSNEREPKMLKLIQAYIAEPTLKNAQKIRSYESKHMMAVCMLTVEQSDIVATAINHANNPVAA